MNTTEGTTMTKAGGPRFRCFRCNRRVPRGEVFAWIVEGKVCVCFDCRSTRDSKVGK